MLNFFFEHFNHHNFYNKTEFRSGTTNALLKITDNIELGLKFTNTILVLIDFSYAFMIVYYDKYQNSQSSEDSYVNRLLSYNISMLK